MEWAKDILNFVKTIYDSWTLRSLTNTLKGYSHDNGITFILKRVHPFSIYFSTFVNMIPKRHFVPVQVIRERVHCGFSFRMKFSFWYEASFILVSLKTGNPVVRDEWCMRTWSGAKSIRVERERLSLSCSINKKELKKRRGRRQRQRKRQKAIGFDLQNNNFARASRFVVHFFAVTARLRSEKV